MSKLLMDEKPLIVMPRLAVQVGLPESIFLQQLHYWLDKSANVQEENKWVYNTVKEWQIQFPFWSESTIRRIIDKLEKSEIIISGNFNKLPIDKTKWYRINYPKLDEISTGNHESRNRQSSSQIEHMDCSKRADGLPNMNRPLPESTTESTSENNNNNDNMHVKHEIETPFSFYEKNGFGILMPHVGEKIGSWIDDMNEELVIHAMKISIENGFSKWSYTDAILKDWHNKKISSVAQVLASEKKREQEKVVTGKRNYRPVREENAPEWFGKDKQSEKEMPVQEASQAEIDAERAALLKELQGDS